MRFPFVLCVFVIIIIDSKAESSPCGHTRILGFSYENEKNRAEFQEVKLRYISQFLA